MNSLQKKIHNRKAGVGVIGLGTIGLPLATFAAARGFSVRGFDTDPRRIELIKTGALPYEYKNLLDDLDQDRFTCSSEPSVLHGCDIIIVCVPTPVDEHGAMRRDFLAKAAKTIADHIQAGGLMIVESSVEIGTTRWLGEQVERLGGEKGAGSFGLAYCPERYNPGLPAEEHAQVVMGRQLALAGPRAYNQIARVVGGRTPADAEAAAAFYHHIVDAGVQVVSSIETAEATKLAENTFRDVNIAFVNELDRLLRALSISTLEVIEAASKKGFAFLPHTPGLVGGECIPVDTWYLIKQAESMGIDTPLLKAARAVNDLVPTEIFEEILAMSESAHTTIQGAKVSILGTAYKANVFDDRVSPVYELARLLEKAGAEVAMADPLVHQHNTRTTARLVDVDTSLSEADILVLATDHDMFREITPERLQQAMAGRLIYDARNFLDAASLRKNGFTVRVRGVAA